MSLSPPSSPSPKPACPPSSADGLQPVIVSEAVSSAAPAAGLPPSSLTSGPMGHTNSSLPRPSRDNRSPYELLTRALPDITNLYAFGCLCSATLPIPRRVGDRHLADRGELELYMGPSEQSPAHVVYLLKSKRIVVSPKIRVWEDRFPGLKGCSYTWFDDHSNPVDESPHLSSGIQSHRYQTDIPGPPPGAPRWKKYVS